MKKRSVLCGLIVLAWCGFNFISPGKKGVYKWPLPDQVTHSFHSPNFPDKDNPLSREGFDLGRRLFYDTKLSNTKTISCASCHQQQFAFSDTATFSRGIHDRTGDRNSMTLANIAWSSRFFWDGRAADLQEQIHNPVIDLREMGSTWEDIITYVRTEPVYRDAFRKAFPKEKIGERTIKKALEQFTANIYSFDSRYDAYFYNGRSDIYSEQEKAGLKLFNGKAQCSGCHNTVLFTNHQFMNNGLDSIPVPGLYNATLLQSDRGLQKTPSLRNVALTPPYMHDGRFRTLEEVLDFYNTRVHPNSTNLDFRMATFIRTGGLGLTVEEQQAIIAFLHTLTDSTLLHHPMYSDPWK